MPKAPVDYSPTPPAYTASGTTNVSGIATSANFEGPWYIETQSLNIEYNRVPYGYLSATDVSLSDVTATHVMNGTAVIATVNAAYRSRQDWGTYETSSWELPQKFEVLAASTDAQDRSYGDITASTMGPMGNIVTTQEFYRRVPWVGSVSGQTQVDRNVVAANYYAGVRQTDQESHGAKSSGEKCPKSFVYIHLRTFIEKPQDFSQVLLAFGR
jgi:hypothetical protein